MREAMRDGSFMSELLAAGREKMLAAGDEDEVTRQLMIAAATENPELLERVDEQDAFAVLRGWPFLSFERCDHSKKCPTRCITRLAQRKEGELTRLAQRLLSAAVRAKAADGLRPNTLSSSVWRKDFGNDCAKPPGGARRGEGGWPLAVP